MPRALLTAKRLRIANTAGETLEVFEDVGKLDAARSLYGQSDLRVMGVTMDEYEFSWHLREALAASGGPIKPPGRWSRDNLRKRMEKLGPIPEHANPKPEAHHDFPWKHKDWFAQHGIDVNNPAFGRWMSKKRHAYIEKQAPVTYEQYWDQIRISEADRIGGEGPFTFVELLDKLAEAREAYPVVVD